VATTVALLCLPGVREAQAQSIGTLDVRSRLGERFFGAVPVRVDGGVLDPRCIRVLANPNAPDGAEALSNARVRIGSADSVIIETAGAVSSPIVGLRLEVGCGNTVSRDFVVLADIPSDAAGAQPSAAGPATSETIASAPAAVVPPPPVARRPVAPARPAAAPRRARAAEPLALPPLPTIDTPSTSSTSAAATPAAKPHATAVPPVAGTPASAAGTPQTAQRLAELQTRSEEQAAAINALEDRLALLQKQAELLKLQLERTLAATPAATTPTSPSATSASSTAAAVSPAVSTAASTASEPRASAPEPQATASVAPKAAAAPVPQVVQPSPRKEPGVLDLLFDWRVGGGLAVLLLGALALKLRRRPMLATEASKARMSPQQPRPMTPLDPYQDPSMFDKTGEYPVASSFAMQDTVQWPNALQAPAQAQKTAEWVAPPALAPATDNFPLPEPSTAANTQTAGAAKPATMSREFHITQQFQPQAERVVALSAPEEIVQQARTHYMDDGDLFRAIDLLEMAVSVRKDSPRPWQALFAIYRRENMPERFQRLALAYRASFGEDENWPAIQSLGRAMDVDNPVYTGADASQPLPEDLLERWLGVPLDFTAHLLANEMHDQLMSTSPGRRRRRRTQAQ